MSKHDFEAANRMLMNLKKSFDVFLKNDDSSHSFEKEGSETEFGKEVTKIFNENKDNPNVKNLDFQYKKSFRLQTIFSI
jgi:hypothetical protein